MKKATFLLLLLYSIYNYGQDIEYIKKLDTVFIKFKKSSNQTKEGLQDYRFYTFKLKDNETLYFTKPDFKDNSTETSKKYLPRTEKKSFIKKHQKNIVGIDFFKKYGIEKITYEAFSVNSVIYIIDCDEQKKGKIILYRVLMSSSYRMGE